MPTRDKLFIEPRETGGFGAKHEHGRRAVITGDTQRIRTLKSTLRGFAMLALVRISTERPDFAASRSSPENDGVRAGRSQRLRAQDAHSAVLKQV